MDVRAVQAELLFGTELYTEVILKKLVHARESVWIATANVKAMLIQDGRTFRPLVDLCSELAQRGVDLRLLHAELPSRPFRAAFDRHANLIRGGLALRICPRVHFKTVLVDGAWAYVGSANLTGAGLGAKGPDRRNFELGFVTEDFEVIDRVTALYESIWKGTECARCKVRDSCPDPIGPAAPPKSKGLRLGRSRRLAKPVRW